MRSTASGAFSTILLLVPILAIPALAVFGIPQLAPLPEAEALSVRSGSDDELDEADAPTAHSAADHDSIDGESRRGIATNSQDENPRRGSAVARDESWPEGSQDSRSPAAGRGRSGEKLPGSSRDRSMAALAQGATTRAGGASSERSGPDEAWAAEPDLSAPSELIRTAATGGRAGNRKDLVRTAGLDFDPRRDPRAIGGSQGPDDHWSAEAGDDSRRMPGQATELAADPRMMARGFRRQPMEHVRDASGAAGKKPKPKAAVESSREDRAEDRESLTWQAAVDRLNELEIHNFRLEPGSEPHQFIFICSYTPADNPKISYRFEAEAHEPLRAVEKVLEQIDQWRSHRQVATRME